MTAPTRGGAAPEPCTAARVLPLDGSHKTGRACPADRTSLHAAAPDRQERSSDGIRGKSRTAPAGPLDDGAPPGRAGEQPSPTPENEPPRNAPNDEGAPPDLACHFPAPNCRKSCPDKSSTIYALVSRMKD